MAKHHEIWLEAHPDRTADWLSDRLEDGFELHHVDGDRNNNAPDNLVLIEWRDHRRLHRMPEGRVYGKRGPHRATLMLAERVGPWRRHRFMSIRALAEKFGVSQAQIRHALKIYESP